MVGVPSSPVWTYVKPDSSDPRVDVCERPVEIIEGTRLREDEVVATVSIPALDVRRAKPSVAPDIEQHENKEYEHQTLHKKRNSRDAVISAENKISDCSNSLAGS